MSASAQQIKTVFVIAMENHNWTQPVVRKNSVRLQNQQDTGSLCNVVT